MVQYLLEQGAKPKLCTHSGVTALDMATRDHLTDIIHLLELHNQRLTEELQAQPLMTAVRKRDISAVKRLIAEGVDVDQKSTHARGPDDGHSPLLVAARDGHTAIVQVLLNAGANPPLVDGLIKATPGHKAGYMGPTEVSRLLIHHGLEIDAQGPYNGYTALHDAIWHGDRETANIFLEAGARVDLRGHDGLTPPQMAHAYEYQHIVTALEAKQAE